MTGEIVQAGKTKSEREHLLRFHFFRLRADELVRLRIPINRSAGILGVDHDDPSACELLSLDAQAGLVWIELLMQMA